MAISLNKVTYTNFRSFLGTHTVEFDKSGLCLIQGVNQDSFGESGSGKSSIILGICYLIGINTYSAKELQCWSTDEAMEVVGEFSIRDEPLIIARGKKLSVTYKGETITGKEAESHIDRLFGVSAAMRGALVYRGQKAPGLFLGMTDSEKKEFLTELLGLNVVEEAISASGVKAKSLEESVGKQKVSVSMLEHELGRLPVKPTDPDSSFDTTKACLLETIKTLESALNVRTAVYSSHAQKEDSELKALTKIKDLKQKSINDQIKEIRDTPTTNHEAEELSTKFKEVSERLDRLKAADKVIESALLTKRQQAISFIKENEKEIKLKNNSITEIVKQQTSLIKGECYACGSPDKAAAESYRNNTLAIEQLKIQIEELKGNLTPLDETQFVLTPNPLIEQFKTARDAIYKKQTESVVNQESALNTRIQPLKDEATEVEKAFFADFIKIQEAYTRQSTDFLIEINNTKDDIRLNKTELSELESDYNQSIKAVSQWQEQHTRIQTLIKEATTKLDNATISFNEELDYQELLKGFLDRIFLEVLEQITQEANLTMGSLPNISHLSLQFKTEKTTQKGTTKQSITPVVFFKGSERPLKSGCSGGMYTSVELAVDWALFKVISERTGTSFNFLMLDEVFVGLDNVTKALALEVLQTIASDKLIICIDHGSETQQLFNQTIKVLLKDGASSIVQS